MKKLCAVGPGDPVRFPIQGSGEETRAFVYIDDFVDGVMVMMDRGAHLNVYHIGTEEEVSIAEAAALVGKFYGRDVEIVPGAAPKGGTARRCPDISKMASLGYAPKVALAGGLPVLARWYDENADQAPAQESD